MRQIKFRAWFKDEKEMRKVAMLRWEYGRMSRIAGYKLDTDNNGWTDYDPQTGKIELMQFTGLLDKNGKEIYEGDIFELGDNFPAKVYWDLESGSWRIEELGIVHEKGEKYPRTHEILAYTTPPVIIGNIYENPNLLKDV